MPLSIHLRLLVDIHSNNVLVDPEQVDDGMIFVHKDIRTARDLHIASVLNIQNAQMSALILISARAYEW